jgi:hypothetical protein
MTFTFDPTTPLGKVRLLCTDSVAAYEIFSDADITAFMDLELNDVRNSAALALETIASSEVLVQKVIRLLDISTNGAQESAALLERARMLRAQSANASAGVTSGIDIAEMNLDDFSYRERVVNEALEDL